MLSCFFIALPPRSPEWPNTRRRSPDRSHPDARRGPSVYVGRYRVAMHNDRFVLDESTSSLVVAPDAPCPWIGRRAAEDTPEHLQGGVDPVCLVNCGDPVAFDAWD